MKVKTRMMIGRFPGKEYRPRKAPHGMPISTPNMIAVVETCMDNPIISMTSKLRILYTPFNYLFLALGINKPFPYLSFPNSPISF